MASFSDPDISKLMTEMGHKGGRIGGKRRLTTLSATRRRAIARAAAHARWQKKGRAMHWTQTPAGRKRMKAIQQRLHTPDSTHRSGPLSSAVSPNGVTIQPQFVLQIHEQTLTFTEIEARQLYAALNQRFHGGPDAA